MPIKRIKRKLSTIKKAWLGVGIFFGTLLLLFGLMWVITPSANDVIETFKQSQLQQPTVIYDKDGNRLDDGNSSNYRYLPLARIPQYVKNAMLSAQDFNFYNHSGVDYIAMIKASRKSVKGQAGRFAGETITQRLVGTLLYGEPTNLFQRLQVYFVTKKIENAFSKDQIFEYYLNSVQFEDHIRGIETASNLYFGKSCTHINEAEAAMLAAIAVLPVDFSFKNDMDAIKAMQLLIIEEMAQNQFVNFKDTAYWYKKVVKINRDTSNVDTKSGVGAVSQYIINEVKALGIEQSGIEVYTTLDQKRMKFAKTLGDKIKDGGMGFNAPTELQIELIDTDIESGAIRAIYANGVNVFESKLPLLDEIKDISVSASVANGNELISKISWDKDSYYDSYFSNPKELTSLHEEQTKKFLQSVRVEVKDDLPASETTATLQQLVGMTLPFLNNGKYFKPFVISKVQTISGDLLYERKDDEPGMVLKPKFAYIVRTLWNHYSRYILRVGTAVTAMKGSISPDDSYLWYQVTENNSNLISLWAGHNSKRGKFLLKNNNALVSVARFWQRSYNDDKKISFDNTPPQGVSFKNIRQENWGISAASQVRSIPFINL